MHNSTMELQICVLVWLSTWHLNAQVSKVPPLGEILASSPNTPVEIFCVGDTALGIQGHPEFSKDVVEDLLRSRVESGAVPVSAQRWLWMLVRYIFQGIVDVTNKRHGNA